MTTTELTILGGGLAGVTLALHVKQLVPSARITILERRTLPYPEAIHKVGESTVELAAHYFAQVLGLREHMREHQLRKLGLRLFFTSNNPEQIESRVEMGANKHLSAPTYQIDRGILENFLIERAHSLGITFIAEARVRDINLAAESGEHTVTYERGDKLASVTARWVVDASGRAAILKRSLGLEQESLHDSNAVWFRIREKINIDDWCDNPAWKAGHDGMHSRWYSTNHLTGEGYWVWLIPLSSGYTSVGIVTDPKLHPLSKFRSFDDSLAWLHDHEPQFARILEPLKDKVADFKALKHYAHKCTRVLSGERWAVTGDSGVFIDPLYSPGSDFIAIQNTFIADCIKRDLADERFIGRTELYNDLFILLTDNVLYSFHEQYPVFGNSRVMPLKVVWDYTVYWGFLAFIAMQQRFCDFEILREIREELEQIYTLNREMQNSFIRWHQKTRSAPIPEPGLIDIAAIPFLVELNRELTASYDSDSFLPTLRMKVQQVRRIGEGILYLGEHHSATWHSTKEFMSMLVELDSHDDDLRREPSPYEGCVYAAEREVV